MWHDWKRHAVNRRGKKMVYRTVYYNAPKFDSNMITINIAHGYPLMYAEFDAAVASYEKVLEDSHG